MVRICGGGVFSRRLATVAASSGAGGAGAHGWRWASSRARGGGLERRRVAAVVWNGGCRVDERRREIGDGGCGSRRERSGRNREGEAGGAGAREIYDRWSPRIFLSPVDPTLRV